METKRTIEFAPQDEIAKNEVLSQDFVLRIFDIEGAWVSDESILWDFDPDATDEQMCLRIKNTYGVDVSDIESGNVSKILARIAASGWQAASNNRPRSA